MDTTIEDLLNKSKPISCSAKLRKEVLTAANLAWQRDRIEDQLLNCHLSSPSDKLRNNTLALARKTWHEPTSFRTLMHWALATAAVFLFSLMGYWYDRHQIQVSPTFLSNFIENSPSSDSCLVRDDALSDLYGNALLLGTQRMTHTKERNRNIIFFSTQQLNIQ